MLAELLPFLREFGLPGIALGVVSLRDRQGCTPHQRWDRPGQKEPTRARASAYEIGGPDKAAGATAARAAI